MAPLGRYSIVTADGWTFDFDPAKWNVDVGIPDGFGLPPVQHQSVQLFGLPGQLLNTINVQPRTVTLTATLQGSCLDDLHNVRYQLWKAMRWDRTLDNPPAPFKLYYRNNGNATYLNCYLLDAPTEDEGIDEKVEKVAIKLVAYDPMWYDDTSQSQNLATMNFLGAVYLMARINGAWSKLGVTGTNEVYALASSPDGNTLYIGGLFTNWAGIGAADYIAAYDLTTGVWSALGAGMNERVYALTVAPDGTLYAGGRFTTAGGVAANYIAKWDGSTWAALGVGLDNYCHGITIAVDGTLYAVGQFANAGGGAASCIAKWSGTAWSALGTGLYDGTAIAYAVVIAPDGTLYAGGAFHTAGGVSVNHIAKWNGAAWSAVGTGGANNEVRALAIANDGTLYAGGAFTTIGGVAANYIARWNGWMWFPLGTGTNDQVRTIVAKDDGSIYVGGMFNHVATSVLAIGAAKWNGTSWESLGIYVNVSLWSANTYALLVIGDDIFLGGTTDYSAEIVYAQNSLTVSGSGPVYPIITAIGPGRLYWLENSTSGKKMFLDLLLSAGEIATIDLSPGIKTFTSNLRGNLMRFSSMLPTSDFASWALEGDPIAPLGVNLVNVLLVSIPLTKGDTLGLTSAWSYVTGVTYANTNNGIMYVSVINDGGGFYHVALYKDSARSQLVGHTASYNANGTQAIIADGASGLGGSISVTTGGVSTSITVMFPVVKIEWTNVYLSADEAVQ